MSENEFANFIKDKRILVTGGTGSIGRVLIENLLPFRPKVIRSLSRNITKQEEFRDKLKAGDAVRFILGDIRDADRVLMACEDIDVIFHSAAFKHVPQGEFNPFEVVQTNVVGTQNLVAAALRIPSVSHMTMISTSKVTNPTNIMGASKLLAERLMVAAHYIRGRKNKIFTTARLGNVLNTSGSVLPLFQEQIKQGYIEITHGGMARFFITISDAARFLFDITVLARGGEIFVPKMPALAIKDLAEVYATRFTDSPIPIRISSVRPGETLNETLLTPEEASTALETAQMFIIVPQVETEGVYMKDYTYPDVRPLSSKVYDTATAPRLSKEEISKLLDRAGV